MHVIALVALLAADPVPVEELTAREGEVEVIGRYQEFLDLNLKLRGSALTFALASQEYTRPLFDLRAGVDRLIVRGRFTGKDTIAVESLEKTETEAQAYARRGDALQGPSAALLDLGARAMAGAAAFDDAELADAGRAILRKGFLVKKQETPAGDAAAHLAWVKDMVARLGDTKWAIEEVSAALARDPSWEAGGEFLRSLGCIQWRDAWYTRDDFLATQGLVGAGGDWRLPEESAIKDAAAYLGRLKRSQEILRSRTDEAYETDAKRGILSIGMTRREAVSAWGFPDDVRRIPQEGYAIDQWRYGGRLVYLLDDTVAMLPAEKAR
ncbi:MAG TPA: hypothetical protein DCM87_21615 [Planctomycetes bacterium]|nr:hypothetical protein [Planctomycetota bacterium]